VNPVHERTDPSENTGLEREAVSSSRGSDSFKDPYSSVETNQRPSAVASACTRSCPSSTQLKTRIYNARTSERLLNRQWDLLENWGLDVSRSVHEAPTCKVLQREPVEI